MFEYFWLICGLWCGVGGALGLRSRLRQAVSTGELSQEDVDVFCRRYALWILVPSVLLWLMQLSLESAANPEFIRWPHPQGTIAIAMVLFLWSALLYYVFARNGADELSLYLGAGRRGFLNPLSSPLGVKIVAVLVVVSGLSALLLY